MIRFPIICCNGIGDSLLILGRVPIQKLAAWGIRFNLFYETPEHAAQKILVPFFNQIRYVRFVERAPSKTEKFIFQKIMSASQRLSRIWPVPFVPRAAERLPRTQPPNSSPKILLQTHLDGHHGWKGGTAKMWQIEKWISVIAALHGANCDVAVMEWEAPALAQIKNACPYVTDASKGDLRDLCLQMENFDCIVSVDSWVKYAAAWRNKRQVIMLPDLRNGYTPDFAGITADRIANWWFHGLVNNPGIKIIGLKREGEKYEFSLARLDDLKPEQLVQEILLQIKKGETGLSAPKPDV